ncbi:MAG TPA: PfkB family carbohydrate kinase [Acidimicrobiales bacterium]|nr:PfkB family carbohydrate kinase [Acidimicrobiales bacterium]
MRHRVPGGGHVRLGARGALLADAGGRHHWRPPPGAVVDTTGAGDTFCGVLAAGLAQGLTLPEATRRAVAASALSVRVAGARAGMPTRAAIEEAAPGASPDEAARGG